MGRARGLLVRRRNLRKPVSLKRLLGKKGRDTGMKKVVLGFGIALVVLCSLATLSPLKAQSPNEPLEFDLFKMICPFIPGCSGDDEGAGGEQFPTPDPNQPTPPYATPVLLPTNPPSQTGNCAQPLGSYICGSRTTPLAGCGHCGVGYPASERARNCDRGNDELWGTAYAIDIKKTPNESITMPAIFGESVTWYHYAEKKYSNNAIQRYSGIANGEAYILQLHHTKIGSGIGIGKTIQSGQRGGQVCSTCDHVHIQIAQDRWKNAASYYCH